MSNATLPLVLYLVALGSARTAGLMQARADGRPRRRPWLTYAMAGALIAMFALQLAQPTILPLLRREPALVQQTQLWRAVGALFVQDGGALGFAFNLALLVLIGAVAERNWGKGRWLLVYLGGGIATEFLALAWQPQGAGNSIACFALAGALITYSPSGGPRPLLAAIRLAGLVAGAGLIVLFDIHGMAFALGAVAGAAFTIRDRRAAALSAPRRSAAPGRSATGG
jgi:rhomboid protease GluP